MLDRKQTPLTYPIQSLSMPKVIVTHLSNGIELHTLLCGDQAVCRIDLMFGAGRYDQSAPLIAETTNLLLKEGAAGKSGSAIAEKLDFYGAWLQHSTTQHNSYVTLYIPSKQAAHTLPLLADMVLRPDFPEEALRTIMARRKQQYLVELEKVKTIALSHYNKSIYGTQHPYNNQIEASDYDNITVQQLRKYHAQHYVGNKCRIIVTGDATPAILDLIEQHFGSPYQVVTPNDPKKYAIESFSNRLKIVHKQDAMQSAVRIGRHLVPRSHPDYMGLRILNTVFGGYFGSRLMANIREEKGYTYGIGSSIVSQRYATVLSIATQTATKYTEPLIKEVFYEMRRLQECEIKTDELACVTNYMIGELARTLDGILNISDAYLSLLANDLSSSYYTDQLQIIRNITPNELHRLACTYFDPEAWHIVVVGNQSIDQINCI